MNRTKDLSQFGAEGMETPAQKVIIKNGTVIDPLHNIYEVVNVLLAKGKIKSLCHSLPSDFSPDLVIDAQGLWVLPGLMDMHVHLREPGQEAKETIETGTQAAVAGGFTTIVCMPNTLPPIDDAEKISYIVNRTGSTSCRVYPIGAITKNLEGKELTSFKEMIQAGALAFSDDGKSVDNANLMRQALIEAKGLAVPLLSHCEDHNLSANGHMNEGFISKKLGINGIPTIAEDIIVARDIMLAEYVDTSIHICHVSTARSVQLIREAKKRKVKVTCETCPHYFTFTDEDCANYNTSMKMNPPLRTDYDRKEIINGLVDGTIDAIASDHAPHSSKEKNVDFQHAPFGTIGMETMVGAAITYLVRKQFLSPSDLVVKMSWAPHKILKLPGGSLTPDSSADITIIDPHAQWRVDAQRFFSKSRNAIFTGMDLYGLVKWTILEGKIVYKR